MVDNMEVDDVVKEEATLPTKQRTIHGGCCSALEIPLPVTVMRKARIRMLEIGDHNNWRRR